SAVYSPDGSLLFGRDNSLVAVPFDMRRLRVVGEATPVAPGVGRFVTMYMPVTVSDTGRLVYEARDRRSRLGGHDLNGRRGATIGEPMRQGDPVVSADGAAVLSWKGGEDGVDLWLDEVGHGSPTRITFSGQDVLPILSPNGDETIFRSNRSGTGDLYRKS